MVIKLIAPEEEKFLIVNVGILMMFPPSARSVAEIVRLFVTPLSAFKLTVPFALRITGDPKTTPVPPLAKFMSESAVIVLIFPFRVTSDGAVAVTPPVNVVCVASAPIVKVPVFLKLVEPATVFVAPKIEIL